MTEYQYSLSIYVPHVSKTTALKKQTRTEMYTKKLPTFSRLRLEKKGIDFSSVYRQAQKQILGGQDTRDAECLERAGANRAPLPICWTLCETSQPL